MSTFKECFPVLAIIILLLVVWMYYISQKECMCGCNKNQSAENFIVAGAMTGATRGYNTLPSGGSYSNAMLSLSDQEKMHLGTIDPDLLTRWKGGKIHMPPFHF